MKLKKTVISLEMQLAMSSVIYNRVYAHRLDLCQVWGKSRLRFEPCLTICYSSFSPASSSHSMSGWDPTGQAGRPFPLPDAVTVSIQISVLKEGLKWSFKRAYILTSILSSPISLLSQILEPKAEAEVTQVISESKIPAEVTQAPEVPVEAAQETGEFDE